MTETNPSNITDEIRWGLLQRKAQEVRACRAFSLFREQGIEPILIKGLAAGRYYPDSHPRLSIDMDLAVEGDDFAKADLIARAASPDGLAIDLHRELRHLDTAPWADLFAGSEILDVDGGSIRVLRPEDHLRVICVHWLNDGGGNKERLWDVYYMVANRPTDFDWDRFLQPVSERRRRWLICTIGLAHRFLGLDLDDTPIKDEARNLPDWLIKAVEREWSSETSFIPLETAVHDRSMLVKQILQRFRPNPIRATIEMEGSFDAKTRFFYQIGNFFMRIAPSYRRVSESIKGTSQKPDR